MYGYLKNELYHHGVKGMKWGIRRYQTEDGHLTQEGRKRYGLSGSKVQGTLKERVKALNRAGKDLEAQRKADYDSDIRAIKDNYKGKERRKQIKSYNDYYITGQKYLQKSVKEELSKKYGKDAWDKREKQQVAQAVAGLAGLVVSVSALEIGRQMLLNS